MDFVIDNYLGFVVVGILVLMIIIGFIAEKTDFGRKPFNQNKKEKTEKIKKAKESEEEPIETNESEEPVVDSALEIPTEDIQVEDVIVPGTEDLASYLETPVEGALPEDAEDQLVPDLDIPEFSDAEDVPEKDLEVVEDIVTDDSEDDVWKF